MCIQRGRQAFSNIRGSIQAALVVGLLYSATAASPRPDYRVDFHEIHYHAPGNDPGLEFVELYNSSPNLRDVSNWYFSEG